LLSDLRMNARLGRRVACAVRPGMNGPTGERARFAPFHADGVGVFPWDRERKDAPR